MLMELSTYFSQRYLEPNLEKGWAFRAGNPEFFRHRDRLVVPGGRVLDLGIGWARSSMFFAMQGMIVEGIDLSPNAVDAINQTAAETGLPISARQGDIATIELGNEAFDVIIMDFTFVHFDSKQKALLVIERAFQALKVGGHLWIRTAGKEDENYSTMPAEPPPFVLNTTVDEDVRWGVCGCSGKPMYEPLLSLGQTDLLQFALFHGMKIVISNTMPLQGGPNFMYGEDFPVGNKDRKMGYVTILAQRVWSGRDSNPQPIP